MTLFHGQADKSYLTARDYLDGFDKAARTGKCTTDERKINEFTDLLREGLRGFPFLDLTKWDTLKSMFLKDYEKKFTAKTICANFRDLTATTGPRYRASSARCTMLPLTRWGTSPHTWTPPPSTPCPTPRKLESRTPSSLAWTNPRCSSRPRCSLPDSAMSSDTELWRMEKLTHWKSQEMEQIKDEKHHKKTLSMVKAVIEVVDGPSYEVEDQEKINLGALDKEELGMINAIRFQRGKSAFNEESPLSRRVDSASSPLQALGARSSLSNAGSARRWETCRRSASPGAPEVDTNGKPYSSTSAKKEDSPLRYTQLKRSKVTSPATPLPPSTPSRK